MSYVSGDGHSRRILTRGLATSATGPLCANWIAQKLTWQWVYWVQLCAGGLCWVLCVFFFPETRGDVILKKRCAKLEKETGKHHFVHGLDVHESWGEAFKVSCSRPLLYLVRLQGAGRKQWCRS